MENRNAEKGYLLILMIFVAIAIAMIFASVSFYYARTIRQNQYFAFGQQMAQIANAAHYYAQMQQADGVFDYEANPDMTNDITLVQLQGDDFLPDPMTILPVMSGVDTEVTIKGIMGPRNMLELARGATAYLYVNFSYSADREPSPSNINAIVAGAASEGLLVGLPKSPKLFGLASNDASAVTDAQRDDCSNALTGLTDKAWVAWGDGPYDCMSNADIDGVFGGGTANSMEYFDFIIPTWTVSQSKQDLRALYRIRQPGLPMVHTMQVDVDMAGNDVESVMETQTDYTTAEDANVLGELYVVDTSKDFSDPAYEGSRIEGTAADPGRLDAEEFSFTNKAKTDADAAGTILAKDGVYITRAFDPAEGNLTIGENLFVTTEAADPDTISTHMVLSTGPLATQDNMGTALSNTLTVTNQLNGEDGTNDMVMTMNQPTAVASEAHKVEITNMSVGSAGTSARIYVDSFSGAGGGHFYANNIDFLSTGTVSTGDSMGAQNVEINGAGAALTVGNELQAQSLDANRISGIRRIDANNQCYGACPDVEIPPDPSPFD